MAGPSPRQAYLESLYTNLAPELRRYLRGRLPSPDVAEDVLQETFLRAAESLEYGPFKQPRSWLYRVARNLLVDRRRSQAYRTALLPRDDLLADKREPAPQARGPPEGWLPQALEELPEHYREVLALHYGERLRFEEVADRLGITRTNAKVRAHRAREALRERWLQEAPPDDGGLGDVGREDG